MSISASQIFDAPDRSIESVECPEWGGVVHVRTLSGHELDTVQASLLHNGKPTHDIRGFRARLLVHCLCDAQGVRILADDDGEKLNAKSAGVLQRLFKVASRLNGLEQGDVDEMVKNS